MILINLLPSQLKKVERKSAVPYMRYVIVVAALFLMLHILLGFVAVTKKVQIVSLKGRWNAMEPQSKETVAMKAEMKALENKVGSLEKLLKRKVSLTEILSGLNLAVPKGLWLERFSLTDQGLVIQGSVVSLTQNEMTTIGVFLQEIKKNKAFAELFSKVELNSVQRRVIKTYDVVDFILLGTLHK